MNHLLPPQRLLRFGTFELDVENRQLRKQGIRVRLQEQPFQILLTLLERPGMMVTREELRRRLWPTGTYVDFDRGLYNSIKKLREALADSAEKPRFVETLSRRGYRFIGQVEPVGNAVRSETGKGEGVPGSGLPQVVPKPTRRWLAMSLAAAAAVAVVLALTGSRLRAWLTATAGVPPIHSIVVLPLQNLSGDPSQEYFSEGMTDALTTDLAQIGSLRVISRTSAMRYAGTKKSLPEIARELKVDAIVEGTVQRSGDRVRITAQLIHGPLDEHIWANTYERDFRDIFELERDVTQDIAQRIQAKLGAGAPVALRRSKPTNSAAMDAYLQGKYHRDRFGRGGGDEEKRKSAEYFQQAIDADPGFAPAYVALANAHLYMLWPTKQDAETVVNAAARAVALDPDLADAHEQLGEIKERAWNWQAAEEEYRHAIALNPSSARAHGALGELLDNLGRFEEGWKESQTAQELDPDSDHLSEALEVRGQYDRAIAVLEVMLKRDPDAGYDEIALFRIYSRKGMPEEAVQHLQRTLLLFGLPQVSMAMQKSFLVSGYRGALSEAVKGGEQILSEKRAFFPVNLAELYAALGDRDRAFYWLEQSYAQHGVGMFSTDLGLERLNRESLLEPLRPEPRFKDLVRRVGLPAEPAAR